MMMMTKMKLVAQVKEKTDADLRYMKACQTAQFASDARLVRDLLIEKIEGTGCNEEIEMITSTVVSKHEDGTIEILIGLESSSNGRARRVKVAITRV